MLYAAGVVIVVGAILAPFIRTPSVRLAFQNPWTLRLALAIVGLIVLQMAFYWYVQSQG